MDRPWIDPVQRLIFQAARFALPGGNLAEKQFHNVLGVLVDVGDPRIYTRSPYPQFLVQFAHRSEEHTSELQSLMRISYAVFCLKKKTKNKSHTIQNTLHAEENIINKS